MCKNELYKTIYLTTWQIYEFCNVGNKYMGLKIGT